MLLTKMQAARCKVLTLCNLGFVSLLSLFKDLVLDTIATTKDKSKNKSEGHCTCLDGLCWNRAT